MTLCKSQIIACRERIRRLVTENTEPMARYTCVKTQHQQTETRFVLFDHHVKCSCGCPYHDEKRRSSWMGQGGWNTVHCATREETRLHFALLTSFPALHLGLDAVFILKVFLVAAHPEHQKATFGYLLNEECNAWR